MNIHSTLKADKDDPEWVFTPDKYFEKEFRLLEPSHIELGKEKSDKVVFRHTPVESEMMARQIKIDVRENAKLNLTVIHDADKSLQQVFLYDIILREGATLILGMFVKGGKLNKHLVKVELESEADFNLYGHNRSTIEGGDCEIVTNVTHAGAGSKCGIYISSQANKKSQTVFQSIIKIGEDAPYSHALIDVTNLVGGDDGRCFCLPEVYNDCDTAVVNTRVNTTFVNEGKTHYLQSRGMTSKDALSFVSESFRYQALDLVDADIRLELEHIFES